MKLHTKIFIGLLAGLLIGGISKAPGASSIHDVVIALEPLGTAFIRLITMVVVPLVVGSLFVGVASLGDVRRLGRIGGKTLAYFLITTLVAAIVGLAVAKAARVGQGLDPGTHDALAPLAGDIAGAAPAPDLAQTLVRMVPQNPFAAAAETDLLPLIIAVCIFGAAAAITEGQSRRTVVSFFEGVNDLSMVVIGWLMRLAPAGVFVLIASTVARSGIAGRVRGNPVDPVGLDGPVQVGVRQGRKLLVRVVFQLGVELGECPVALGQRGRVLTPATSALLRSMLGHTI